MAEANDVFARLMLWTGVSLVREQDGKAGLLSMGMEGTLGLPNPVLASGPRNAGGLMEYFWNLLAHLAERDAALPAGDTVGRTAGERLPVR